jgi:putative selenate reductase
MSKVMKPTSLTALLRRAAGEYAAKKSIFEIPETVFKNMFSLEEFSHGLAIMSGKASLPVGPAAGPHTQIAPNLLAAYLAGARVFELKTVQQNDRLDIEKPCIDALDEGHNVEWSTELSLDEARKEYLNGWIAINLFASMFSRKPGEFIFNMSVGYTLDGIRGEKMESFIEGMRRPEASPYWEEAMSELSDFVASGRLAKVFGEAAADKARKLASHVPVRPVHSVTLSTMHGCPPEEIGKIGAYLMEEKGFDTYIKLNPTLVGYDAAREILDRLGWDEIVLKRENFEHDLQYPDAIALVTRLGDIAKAKGRRFGIKLSNTLANANVDDRLPGAERYMSGRALFPVTIRLAASLAASLPGFGSRFSFCGGVSALNASDLIKCGVGPLTTATDILKPGGYLRMSQIASEAAAAMPFSPETPDAETLTALADSVFAKPEYRKEWKAGTTRIDSKLPLYDCFAAPCVEACPVRQKAPAYIASMGAGKPEEALATILSDNPLPHITGVLCDHVCQENCARVDYEGPVRIRDVKLAAARAAVIPGRPLPSNPAARPGKTAIIGAGPAGLACAHHLALAGQTVMVFDSDSNPGGVPANVIPGFRISREDIAADIDRLTELGVEFSLGKKIESLDALRKQGFDTFFVAVGAPIPRRLELAGEGIRMMDALEFLRKAADSGTDEFSGIADIIVAGGGNTACDAVRVAVRLPGTKSVRLSYRRTRKEMPADREELENAISEATRLNDKVLIGLSVPERAEKNRLTLRVMKLGEKDASGRRSPLPTENTIDLPCDLLVVAVGESSDAELLAGLGIDPRSPEKAPKSVFLGGDALRGPSSIISAEADGRRVARAILADRGIVSPNEACPAPAMSKQKLAKRGMLLPSLSPEDPGFASREAERCLACESACLRCVEVCPNRANLFIETGSPFGQEAQILHVDRLCNECGNCGFFCPYEGEPFTGKPTLFDRIEDLSASRNAGFFFETEGSLPSLVVRLEVGGEPSRFDFAAWNGANALPAASGMIALAREVYRNHAYLLEEER